MSLKISMKLKPRLELCVPLVKSTKYLLCIDGVKCKSLGGLFHQPVEEKKPKRRNKNACQAAMSNGSMAI